MSITGEEIRHIRSAFGWSIDQFARVLGVHPVTLNRWELAGSAQPKIEGMAHSVLLGLRQRILQPTEGKRAIKASARATADEVDQLLLVGGVLLGLAALLAFINKAK